MLKAETTPDENVLTPTLVLSADPVLIAWRRETSAANCCCWANRDAPTVESEEQVFAEEAVAGHTPSIHPQ